jgi:4-amino-4-deoxy-L-arabinose transferase-like glycosyltransferase
MILDKKLNLFFWLFTFALIVILILPRLIQDGMFIDGMLYSAVSHNFAKGHGSFWFPHFGYAHHTNFHEQPPLMFAIQGYFFKIFGDSMYVERFYSFLFALLNALIIALAWREIFKNNAAIKRLSWFPVLLWIIIPVCFWGFCNNIEENTMSFFCLMSVLFTLKALQENPYKSYLFIALSGCMIFLASLTKGIQGTFVLALPAFIFVAERNISFKKAFIYSLALFLIPAFIYLMLVLNDDVKESLSRYLLNRVFNSIQNVSNVGNRFYLLGRLIIELLAPLGVGLIIFSIKHKLNKQVHYFENKKKAFSFVLLGLSGALPLMVTLEQRGFYLNNSFPYFAIAIALIFAPKLNLLLLQLNQSSTGIKIVKFASVSLLIVGLSITTANYGKTGRDYEKLHDIYLIGNTIPYGSVLSQVPEMHEEWSMQCYFIRYFYISLDSYDMNHTYFLAFKGMEDKVPSNFEKMPLNTLSLDLYINSAN